MSALDRSRSARSLSPRSPLGRSGSTGSAGLHPAGLRSAPATGICPDCLTHEAELCSRCHTALGCRGGQARHTCLTQAA